jgi:hypothetical protein
MREARVCAVHEHGRRPASHRSRPGRLILAAGATAALIAAPLTFNPHAPAFAWQIAAAKSGGGGGGGNGSGGGGGNGGGGGGGGAATAVAMATAASMAAAATATGRMPPRIVARVDRTMAAGPTVVPGRMLASSMRGSAITPPSAAPA